MPITNFDFPGTVLKQVFAEVPSGAASSLSVACIGRQYRLHRADHPAEAAEINQTEEQYSSLAGLSVPKLPGTAAGGVLDTDPSSQHLVVKNGIYSYYTDAAVSSIDTASRTVIMQHAVKDGLGFTADPRFGTRGARIGDPVILTGASGTYTTEIIRIAAVPNVGYAAITVAGVGTITDRDLTNIQFCSYEDYAYEASEDTFTISSEGALTIQGGLAAPVDGITVNLGTLISGQMFIEYREQVNDYVGKLGVVESLADIDDILGGVVADNPLAVSVYFALAAGKGAPVYFTGVSEETPEAYTEALDFLDKYRNIYSIVPVTMDRDIIKACMASVSSVSEDTETVVRRSLWYGASYELPLRLFSGAGAVTAYAESNAFVTLESPMTDGYYVKPGDVVRIRTQEGALEDYAIKSFDGTTKFILADDARPVGISDTAVQILRTKPVNADLVDAVISQRVTQSERAQCVFADGVMFNGQHIPNYAAAAAAAGMRAYEPVHRPLSNLGYDFFQLVEPRGFTRSQLKLIGAEGIWIIADNDENTPVNLRQVTTAVASNINKDEESIVANADNIAMALSGVGRSLVGNSNIGPGLLEILSFDISTIMDAKLVNESGAAYIGPQVLDWTLMSLYQDPVNLDHVYATVEVVPPKPFNKFILTLRIR